MSAARLRDLALPVLVAAAAAVAIARAPVPRVVPDERPAEAPFPADARALVGGLAAGDEIAGWRVTALHAPRERAFTVDVARGAETLTVEVVRRGARAWDPPKRTARYDLFYRRARPPAPAVSGEAVDALLAAVAARITAHEIGAALPDGL